MTSISTAMPSPARDTDTSTGHRVAATASLRSQFSAAFVVATAFVIASVPNPDIRSSALAAVAALVAGCLLSVFGRIPVFRTVPGWALGIVIMVTLAVAFALFREPDRWVPWAGLIPAAGAFALGLDWRYAQRLRTPVIGSALLVLVTAAIAEQEALYLVTAVWGAAASVVLTLLEADRRAALPHIRRDAANAAKAIRARDLLSTLTLAAAIAAVAAGVLTVPSCEGLFEPDGSTDGASNGASDAGSGIGPFTPGPGGASSAGSGSAGSGSAGSGSAGSGSAGSGTGSAGGGALATPGSVGGTYVLDPNGRFLVPEDRAGGGVVEPGPGADRIPAPPAATRSRGVPPNQRPDPDGWTVTYDAPSGSGVKATVTDPGGAATEWRFVEGPGGVTQIERLAPDESVAGTWYYDPEGNTAAAAPPGRPPATAADGDDTSASPTETGPEPDGAANDLWWVGLGLLTIAIAAGIAWWRIRGRRRTGDAPDFPDAEVPAWAVALAARLEHEGHARGRPRSRAESIVSYARALSIDLLPDPRMSTIGDVISEALFSRRDPGAQARSWAESTLEQITAANPAADRAWPGSRSGRGSIHTSLTPEWPTPSA